MASQFSETNCGWSEYWLKDIMIHFAEDVISNRKFEKKHFKEK